MEAISSIGFTPGGRLVLGTTGNASAVSYTHLDVYKRQNQTIEPQSALITGYDFLIDQANAVSDELRARGVLDQTTLINNEWRGPAFRDAVFDGTRYDLMSLNSHFDHRLFYPNGSPTEPNNLVYADEVNDNAANNFAGTLVFSCLLYTSRCV